jgi:hypothetical protein
VGSLVAALVTTTSRVLREYEWTYRAAYDRTVAEEVKVRGSGNDPTGSLVSSVSKARARSACTDATELLKDALADLRHAENVLLRALDRQDPAESFEALRYPRTATREDLRHAAEAQERRQARGESIP